MIDICYALSDENGTYSKFLGTSLWSLCQQHQSRDLHIHLLHDDTLTDGEQQRFKAATAHFGQEISFYNVEVLAATEIAFLRQELPRTGTSRYTYATFYRLLAAGLLPDEVLRFIYLDADTVVNMDIAALWQLPLGNHSLAAVAEYDEIGRPADNLMVTVGLVDGDDYFNAGMLLVDRQKFLAVGDILRTGIQSLRQIPDFAFYDQDILNLFFARNYQHLDIACNAFVPALQLRGIQQLAAAVYHYDSMSLGLRENDVYDRLFYTVFAQTPWCDADFLYRCFACMEKKHDDDLVLARQVFAIGGRRQRVFCANEASRTAIEQLFSMNADDKYLVMQPAVDWAGRLLQYERVSPKGQRLYILFLQQYEEVRQDLTAAGWREGQEFMDGWQLLPAGCGGYLFRSPQLIRDL